MFYRKFFRLAALLLASALSACISTNTNKLEADLSSEKNHTKQLLGLHTTDTLAPWQAILFNSDEEAVIKSNQTQLSDGSLQLTKLNNSPRGNALLLSFQDHWSSGLFFSNSAIDLSDYSQDGTIEFDLRIDAIEKGKIELLVNCKEVCSRRYNLRDWARANQQRGWQHLAIPIRCLVDLNSDLTNVTRPFTLNTGGKGQVAVANIAFSMHGKGNMPCPSNLELATSPAISDEYWSADWWMPRHKEKVIQANKGEAELIMIGDSITHRWENSGKEIWNRYFSDINTLNLGFGGDRTENVLWRIQHGELGTTQAKLIVMMIGTNNTGFRMDPPQAIIRGVEKIVDELEKQVPQAKILLLEIFPRGAQADSAMRMNNKIASDLIKNLANARGLLFADFNPMYLTDEGILTTEFMPDLLHPNTLGFEIWAKQLEPLVNQYVRKK